MTEFEYNTKVQLLVIKGMLWAVLATLASGFAVYLCVVGVAAAAIRMFILTHKKVRGKL